MGSKTCAVANRLTVIIVYILSLLCPAGLSFVPMVRHFDLSLTLRTGRCLKKVQDWQGEFPRSCSTTSVNVSVFLFCQRSSCFVAFYLQENYKPSFVSDDSQTLSSSLMLSNPDDGRSDSVGGGKKQAFSVDRQFHG